MPFGYVIGTAVTWTLIGAVAAGGNWRIAFWLPALLLLLVLAFWWKAGIDVPKAKPSPVRLSTIIAEAKGIAFVMLAAALAGFVRNGSLIWLPTYILDTELISENLVGLVAALTQVVAIMGLFLARYRVASSDQVFVTAVMMFCAAGLGFLFLTTTTGLFSIPGSLIRPDDAQWRLWLDRDFNPFAVSAEGSRLVNRWDRQYDGYAHRRDGWVRDRGFGGDQWLGKCIRPLGHPLALGFPFDLAPAARGRQNDRRCLMVPPQSTTSV